MRIEEKYFFLVFSGFDEPEYLYRITTTAYHSIDLNLTVVGENINAKTLLIVEWVSFQFPEREQEVCAFDLATGKVRKRHRVCAIAMECVVRFVWPRLCGEAVVDKLERKRFAHFWIRCSIAGKANEDYDPSSNRHADFMGGRRSESQLLYFVWLFASWPCSYSYQQRQKDLVEGVLQRRR